MNRITSPKNGSGSSCLRSTSKKVQAPRLVAHRKHPAAIRIQKTRAWPWVETAFEAINSPADATSKNWVMSAKLVRKWLLRGKLSATNAQARTRPAVRTTHARLFQVVTSQHSMGRPPCAKVCHETLWLL